MTRLRTRVTGPPETVQTLGGLTRYREDAQLSIDNSLSERVVRPVAIGRKNHLFLGDDNDGKAQAILCNVLASTKVSQMESYNYARDLSAQFSDEPPNDLPGLLPDA